MNSRRRAFYVLAIQQAGRRALAGVHLPALPHRRKVPSREFLVFNQELATLLKAGMPLVQSLDILRQRVTNPVVQGRARRRLRARAIGQRAVGSVRGARGLFPGVYTASLLAGEKSGNLEQVLRRYVSYVKIVSSVRRKTISALVYPAILVAALARRRHGHRREGRAGVRQLLQPVRQGAAAVDAVHRRAVGVRDDATSC